MTFRCSHFILTAWLLLPGSGRTQVSTPCGVATVPIPPGQYALAALPFDPLASTRAHTVQVFAREGGFDVHRWDPRGQRYEPLACEVAISNASWRVQGDWKAGDGFAVRNTGDRAIWLVFAGEVVRDTRRLQRLAPGLNLAGTPLSSPAPLGDSIATLVARADLSTPKPGEWTRLAEAVWRLNAGIAELEIEFDRPYPVPGQDSPRITGLSPSPRGLVNLTASQGQPNQTYEVLIQRTLSQTLPLSGLDWQGVVRLQADADGALAGAFPLLLPEQDTSGTFVALALLGVQANLLHLTQLQIEESVRAFHSARGETPPGQGLAQAMAGDPRWLAPAGRSLAEKPADGDSFIEVHSSSPEAPAARKVTVAEKQARREALQQQNNRAEIT